MVVCWGGNNACVDYLDWWCWTCGGLDGDGEEVNGVVSLLLHSSLLSVRSWVQIPPRESIFR